MRIENTRIEHTSGRSRLTARVTWEDSVRDACDVYFEIDAEHGDALAAVPDAFLTAAVTPAMWAGERRIKVDGEVCPELVENLENIAALMHHWFSLETEIPLIEAVRRSRPAIPANPRRAAVFLSGGLDSLAALWGNRLNFPREHPGSIRDGIIVYGLEVESEEPFRHVMQALSALAEEAEVTLLPVSTNVRCLNPSWEFWYDAFMGPALGAVAHALGGRISGAVIGSDYDAPHLQPHGSHPLVEPNCSSHTLKVRYHGLTLSRLAKAKLIAEWTPALRHLRVCNKPDRYRPGQLNCGECEKCVRTMLELVAVDAFDRSPVFRSRTLSADMIAKLYMPVKVQPYYQELVAPLAAAGRADLSHAVARALAHAQGETGLAGQLRKLDREHLNGSLISLKRAMVAPRSSRHPRA